MSEEPFKEPSPLWRVLKLVLERPAEVLGVLTMAGFTATILINALAWQRGVHPAPFFTAARTPVDVPAPPIPERPAPAATPAPAVAATATPAAVAPQGDALVRALQTELAARGHDVGTIDGLVGRKTDAAIRLFQFKAGLDPDGVPSAALLARVKATRPASDSIGALITGGTPPVDPQLLAVERTLSKLGYGPVKVDGLMGTDTRNAIEAFERDRGLPPSGAVSPRLVRELSAVTGAPVE